MNAPTQEQIAAMEVFAAHEGRAWRDELSMVYWYNAHIWTGPQGNQGAIGTTLHGIRNQFGPSWLYDDYKPAKLVRDMTTEGLTAVVAALEHRKRFKRPITVKHERAREDALAELARRAKHVSA